MNNQITAGWWNFVGGNRSFRWRFNERSSIKEGINVFIFEARVKYALLKIWVLRSGMCVN